MRRSSADLLGSPHRVRLLLGIAEEMKKRVNVGDVFDHQIGVGRGQNLGSTDVIDG